MVGTRIKQYEITSKLGEGGMGVVYLADDTRLGRSVALKFLPLGGQVTARARSRFEQEARAAARLNHPHICTIHQFDEHEGHQFLVMEHVEGSTLRDRMNEGPLPIEEITEYAIQIAEALEEAHANGIVHRDIKPGNIMVDQKGRLKVMDFGLATMKGPDTGTETLEVAGTLPYMSPEQARGQQVDAKSDLFSLGIVLYEMATGKHPFSGEYEQAMVYRLVNEDPDPLAEHRSDIPSALGAVISRCLAKEPDDRFDSAGEIVDRLKGKGDDQGRWIFNQVGDVRQLLARSFKQSLSPVSGIATIGLIALVFVLTFVNPGFLGTLSTDAMPEDKSIVVLPVNNLSEESIPTFLSDGITELITTSISQLEHHKGSLWVVPHAEVRDQYITTVAEARKSFGANLAVEGNVRRVDDQFRLTMNLIDGASARELRSHTIELDWNDLAPLRDEVLVALTDMLEVEVDQEAVETMTTGGSLNSGAYRAYFEGRGYLTHYDDVNNIEQAISKFKEAVELDPSFARAFAALGEAYWRKYDATREGRWTESALENAEKAIALSDELPDAYITMALIYNGIGQYADAQRMIEQLPEPEGTASDALKQYARALEGRGQIDRAEQIYKEAVAQKELSWDTNNNLGTFYYRHARFSEAIGPFQKVTELAPENTRGFNNLGAAYLHLGRYDEARSKFNQSLSIRPNYGALSNLGTLYFHEGKYAEAVDHYEQALHIRDTDRRVWGHLAYAYRWSDGDEERLHTVLHRAIELAEQERKIRPNDSELLISLASYHAMLQQEDEARRFLRQVTALEVLEPEAMVRTAGVYEDLGARNTAIHWVEEALNKGYSMDRLADLPGMKNLLEDSRMQSIREQYANSE